MKDQSDKLGANREVWNQAADKYDKPANALPNWGPYHVCQQDSTLIGPIEGRRFLELGFGAGQYYYRGRAVMVPATMIFVCSKLEKPLAADKRE